MPQVSLETAVREFKPSPFQSAFFDFVKYGKGNCFLRARAGTGKTTSVLHGFKFVERPARIFYAVFNKRNQLEAQEKAAKLGITDVDIATFHAFSFRAWRRVCPRVAVDEKGKWEYLVGRESPVPEIYSGFVKKLVSLARQRALGVFGDIEDRSEWFDIIDHFDLYTDLEEHANAERGVELAIDCLKESNYIGRETISRFGRPVVDFDDMIYLPLIFGAHMDQYDFGGVDEGQDTNPARRAQARKMTAPDGRICFVGDEAQSIYGFTGADNDAVDQIIKEFNCTELPLTETFRCPKAVVRVSAPFVGGDYTAHESNPEGEVVDAEEIDMKALTDKDAILCRKTAPIVEYAYTLLRNGIGCHVEGRDIGQGLITVLTKWKIKTTDAFLSRLEDWEEKQTQRLIAKGNELQAQSVRDKADTLRILCEGCQEISQVIDKVNALFVDTNGESKGVTLSTVHKAKGREWPNVYILGYRTMMPSKCARLEWQQIQERNIIYVAMTRAQNKLILVD